MNLVESLLLEHGPCLSSELARKLEFMGMSSDVARQRISRAGPNVHRLAGLIFPRNARFIYHSKHEGQDAYWSALSRDVTLASPAYGPALAALQARDGIVPLEEFSIISGSPIRQRGQVSSDTVLERLEAVRLIQRGNLQGIGQVVMLRADGYLGTPDIERLRGRRLVEKMLLLALRDWARRLGMASHDKITVRGEGHLPEFGTFNWDLVGPSYLVPIVRRSKEGRPNPGFLVADVIAGTSLDEHAVAAFVRKFKLSAALHNLPPFLPILMADGYTREAFRLGRSHGLMLATPRNLLGRDIAIGLATLLETMSKAAAIAVAKPEVIVELFDKLGAIEGADRNLRGSLFELVVGHVAHARFGGSIDIGMTVNFDGFQGEIDVRRVAGGEVWLYECKGYQPDHMVGVEEIDHWLNNRIPGLYNATRAEQRFQNAQVQFEFWTSGGFTHEALALLEARSKEVKRYKIGWKSGHEVRKEIARLQSSGMTKMFDEHYLNHPIARFDRKYDGAKSLSDLALDIELGDHDDVATSAGDAAAENMPVALPSFATAPSLPRPEDSDQIAAE